MASVKGIVCFLLFSLFGIAAVKGQEGHEMTLEEALSINPRKTIVDTLISLSKQYIGVPYRYAGTDSTGFDCSGYMQHIFQKILIELPHSSSMIANQGYKVEKEQLSVGDIVLFTGRNAKSGKVGHVGLITHIEGDEIYFIHASTSSGVREDAVYGNSYFSPRLLGFRSWEW